MTLDLSNPVDREALRWACTTVTSNAAIKRHLLLCLESRERAAKRFGDTRELGHVAARRTAYAVISDPARAAEVLRGLLRACGVDVDDFRLIKTNPTLWECAGEIYFEDPERWGRDPRWSHTQVRLRDVPTIALALLAIPTDAPDARERALAALREAGR